MAVRKDLSQQPSTTSTPKIILQYVTRDIVTGGIEGRAEVQQNKKCGFLIVPTFEDIVVNSQQRGFSRAILLIRGMDVRIWGILIMVPKKLGNNTISTVFIQKAGYSLFENY